MYLFRTLFKAFNIYKKLQIPLDTGGFFCYNGRTSVVWRSFCCAQRFRFPPFRNKDGQAETEGGNINMEVPKNMAGKEKRVKVTLVCTECKQRNYDTTKNKKNDPDRLEMKKYCKFCKKHTVHKETK